MRALSAVELFGFSLSAHTLLALIEVAYVCAIIHSESRGKWDSEGRLEVLHSTCTVRQSHRCEGRELWLPCGNPTQLIHG